MLVYYETCGRIILVYVTFGANIQAGDWTWIILVDTCQAGYLIKLETVHLFGRIVASIGSFSPPDPRIWNLHLPHPSSWGRCHQLWSDHWYSPQPSQIQGKIEHVFSHQSNNYDNNDNLPRFCEEKHLRGHGVVKPERTIRMDKSPSACVNRSLTFITQFFNCW